MKIGDEVYVHGYVDEIRKGTNVDIVIIRNKGGYFGTDASEVILADRKTEPQKSKWIYHSSDGEVDTIQCGKCGGWIEITIPQQLSKLKFCPYCGARNIEDEPQTDCAWK